VSSQSHAKLASVSLTPSPALSLATSASAIAELTRLDDFVPSSYSTDLSQDASSSISESSTFFLWVSKFSFKKVTSKIRWDMALFQRFKKYRLLDRREGTWIRIIFHNNVMSDNLYKMSWIQHEVITAFYSGGLLYINQGFLGLILTIQAMKSLLAFHRKSNADFVLIFSSIPHYRINTCPNFVALVNRVHIIQKQFL